MGILNIKLKQIVNNFDIIIIISNVFTICFNFMFKIPTKVAHCLSDEQNGLSARRMGEDNLCIVREIIKKINKENKTGFITFLDIEKAYSRVNLVQLSKHLGIPNRFINIIKDLYTGT